MNSHHVKALCCYRCNVEQPITSFYKDPGSRTGVRGICKQCQKDVRDIPGDRKDRRLSAQRERSRKRYRGNIEKMRQYQRDWRKGIKDEEVATSDRIILDVLL